MPLLFVLGYLLLSRAVPYVPFFRYFWPLEVWFLGFLVFGILETARRLSGAQRWVRLTLAGVLLFFLTDDLLTCQLRYRQDFALPFEQSMAFVTSSRDMLARQVGAEAQQILAPLAFVPYLTWELNGPRRIERIIIAEHMAVNEATTRPEWILDMPEIYANPRTREIVAQLIKDGGYKVRLTDGKAALLSLSDASRLRSSQ
jgi:hypothetical protein